MTAVSPKGSSMRVSRGVLVTLLATGLLAVPVVSFSGLGLGADPGSVADVVLDGVDQEAISDAPQGLVIASDVHAAGEGPEVVPTDAEPAVLTEPIETDEFTAVSFNWEAGDADGVVVQARVREDSGWSEWFPLPESEDGPDTVAPGGRVKTALLLTSGADGVQVRADATTGTAIDDLRALLIDPGEPAAGLPMQIAGASSRPAFISRAQWGASDPTGDCAPEYASQLKAAIIHHTVSTNTYSAAQSAGLIRAIWIDHTRPVAQGGNGWCDIGYNAIVDRFGQVFEGAAGGLERPVIGAHAGGFNTYTFGVSTLGNFESGAPPAALTEAVAQTVAWKFDLTGINPTSTTQLTSGGGGTAKYAKGTVVTLPVIMGHRDVGATLCPGQHLYDQVGAVRARVIQLVGEGGRNLLRSPENGTVYLVSGSSKYIGAGMGDAVGAGADGGRRLRVPAVPRPLPDGVGDEPDHPGARRDRVLLRRGDQAAVRVVRAGRRLRRLVLVAGAARAAPDRCVPQWSADHADLPDDVGEGVLHRRRGQAGGRRRPGADAGGTADSGGHPARDGAGVPALRAAGDPGRGGAAQPAGPARCRWWPGVAFTTVSEGVRAAALSSLPVRELDDASMRFLTAAASAPGAFVKEAGAVAGVPADRAAARSSSPIRRCCRRRCRRCRRPLLALFPDAGPLAAGTFLKGSTDGSVFVLRGGQLRGIGAWADLVALNGGGSGAADPEIDQRLADLIARGPLQLGPGSLVVSPRSATVYFVNGPG